MTGLPTDDRHPATRQLLRWFEYYHLPTGRPRDVSRNMHDLAHHMVLLVEDGPELSAGLRKLLEAKDCLVRQAIADQDSDASSEDDGR